MFFKTPLEYCQDCRKPFYDEEVETILWLRLFYEEPASTVSNKVNFPTLEMTSVQ